MDRSEQPKRRGRPRKTLDVPVPPRNEHPFNFFYDALLDAHWERQERRASLTDDERREEDAREAAEEAEKQRKWLKDHATNILVRVDQPTEKGQTVVTFAYYERAWLREGNTPKGAENANGTVWFESRDHRFYPFSEFAAYDRTGELPSVPAASNPLAERVWSGFLPRFMEREVERDARELALAEPAPSREEEIEQHIQDLLSRWEEHESERAQMTPEERAAEEREMEEFVQETRAQAAEKERTLLSVRRQDEEDILELPILEVQARGFQPLFAVRQGNEDVYFRASDRKWYRIEAYPEYARTQTMPGDQFLAPPEEESAWFVAAERARAIWRERQQGDRQQ